MTRPQGLEALDGRDRKLVEELARRLMKLRYVAGVLLFGSVARGAARPASDLDILVVVSRKAGPGEHPEVYSVLEGLREHRDVQLLVTDLKDLDPHFLRNALSEGIVLAGEARAPWPALGFERWMVLGYDAAACGPAVRASISRWLRGFKADWRKRTYPGAAERSGGRLVGRATVFMPWTPGVEVARRLRGLGAHVTELEVWR